MSTVRFLNDLGRIPDANAIERSNFILQSMTGNAYFPTPTPTLTVLQDGIEAFTTAVLDAVDGSRLMREARKQKKKELAALVLKLGYYVQLTANGDRLIAQSCGIPLAKDGTPQEMQKPTDVKVINTEQSGIMQISSKRVKGAAAYLHQYTSDPLMPDASWNTMTCTTITCMLEGLTPGTKYFFRIGAVGPKDVILYSDVVIKIAA